MNDLDFLGDFNVEAAAANVEDQDFAPLPRGWYQALITQAEIETTKKGDGKMVAVRLDIEGPTHAGRVVFGRMLLIHPNEKAQEIGRNKFATLCMACGFSARPPKTAALVGKRVDVKLSIERSAQYGDRNRVEMFRVMTSSAPVDADPFGGDDDIPF